MARERFVSDVCKVLALRWSFRRELYIKREICTVPSLYRPVVEHGRSGLRVPKYNKEIVTWSTGGTHES